MRKLMILAVVMAMMLVAAAPAFAHTTAIDDSGDVSYDDSFNVTVVAPQEVFLAADNTQVSADSTLVLADDGSAAAASSSVSQSFMIDVYQVNGGL
jgi:hypothetical protein